MLPPRQDSAIAILSGTPSTSDTNLTNECYPWNRPFFHQSTSEICGMNRKCILVLAICTSAICITSTGCNFFKSRYAMDDLEYAAKYSEGAEKGDIPGKLKQMIDARHAEGLGGIYVSGGAQTMPDSQTALVGLDLGYEYYQTSYFSQRLALTGYAGTDQGYAGADTGVRLQLPTRISPFVGVGMFNGVSRGITDASRDRIDNDDDGIVDEYGEEDSYPDAWLSAIYPELGTHFWLTGHGRLTAFGRYLVTTEGRAQDGWLIGGQFTVFSRK